MFEYKNTSLKIFLYSTLSLEPSSDDLKKTLKKEKENIYLQKMPIAYRWQKVHTFLSRK